MTKTINLTADPIWQLLRRVTFPASIGSLFQTFYNLVDTFFAGKISPEALSALAKSFPIYFIIIAISVGVGQAPIHLSEIQLVKRKKMKLHYMLLNHLFLR